jgi:hypothetical protein
MSSALRLGQGAQRIGVRGFHTSRARMSGGHGPHYPEGPTHNIPWTPKGKWNIRIKLFSFYGSKFFVLLTSGLGFSLPVVAAWWQLYGLDGC